MVIHKSRPYRSKAFLRFCHERTADVPCCLCNSRPWVQLHHFGDDGGRGLKPSDNEVARVCLDCHMENDQKRRALIKNGRDDVLLAFERDALILNREYMRFLEEQKRGKLPASRCGGCAMSDGSGGCRAELDHVEPPADCALEELNLWLVTEAAALGPDEQRDWLLAWSNRRSANVIEFLADPMREIAAESNDKSSRFVARRALRTGCLEGVEDGQDEDRMVR